MPSPDLTPAALAGFEAAALLDAPAALKSCPHFPCSSNGLAWLVGAWLRRTGRPAPRAVRMSRGYTVRVGDMLVNAADPLKLERLS